MSQTIGIDTSDPFQFFDWGFAVAPDESITPQEAGLNLELKSYEIRENSKGDQVPLQTGTKANFRPMLDKDHDSAMVVTKTYFKDKTLKQTELVIRSPHIRTALQSVIKRYPGLDLTGDKIPIIGPPACIFHFRKELLAYGRNLRDETAAQHVAFALNYMRTALADDIIHYKNCMANCSNSPGLDFERLWMEYRPGDLIFVKSTGISWVGRLKEVHYVGLYWRHYYLELERITYLDSLLKYFADRVTIPHYGGFKPFKDLNAFPLKYHPEQESIKQKMIARGKKFQALRGIHQRFYRGTARWAVRKNTPDDYDDDLYENFQVRSRVMVDEASFHEARPVHSFTYKDSVTAQEAPDSTSDEQLMICNHEVLGYSLEDKRWCTFNVDDLKEIDFNATAFDSLLLPREQKETLLALAKVHTEEDLQFDDFIKGKGRGMIILLHGEPGVGKTLTAESLSDYTRKPLFPIRSGDLGIEASALEKSLNEAFEVAAKWKAIILLDEADVFLEKRQINELQRNSLVSVFLRVLEYYEGIMILTTNRIKVFDPAFKSRIHLTIKYHPLSKEYRRTLWRNFIMAGPLARDRSCLEQDLLEELASFNLNGRQIRNMVRTAHALAISANSPLKETHLRTTIEALAAFEREANESDSLSGDDEPDHRAGPSKRRRLE